MTTQTAEHPNLYSITGNVLDINTLLINRNNYLAQAAEIERLQADAIRYSYKEYAAIQQQQKAEIERLRCVLENISAWSMDGTEAKKIARAALEDK